MQPNDYYNLVVSWEPGHWDMNEGSTPKARYLSGSVEPVTGRFLPMNEAVEMSLKRFPAIFACETNREQPTPARVGRITNVEHRAENYYLHFEPDTRVKPLDNATLIKLADALDISTSGYGDLGTSHWSVKNVDLYAVLERQGLMWNVPEAVHEASRAAARAGAAATDRLPHGSAYIASLDAEAQRERARIPARAVAATSAVRPDPAEQAGRPAVFIVHGHNVGVREEVARFVMSLGLEPVILHEQANQGRTILEKFQNEAARAAFAIVLLTGDDRGGVAAVDPARYQLRARQNVVFEFGFFAGRLGLPRVCALVDGHVEQPSDIHGLVYVSLGADWKIQLAREMKTAGIPIDPSKLLG